MLLEAFHKVIKYQSWQRKVGMRLDCLSVPEHFSEFHPPVSSGSGPLAQGGRTRFPARRVASQDDYARRPATPRDHSDDPPKDLGREEEIVLGPPMETLKAIYLIYHALAALSRDWYTEKDYNTVGSIIYEAIAALKFLDVSFGKISIHSLGHMADHLRRGGTAHSIWQFGAERLVSQMSRSIGSVHGSFILSPLKDIMNRHRILDILDLCQMLVRVGAVTDESVRHRDDRKKTAINFITTNQIADIYIAENMEARERFQKWQIVPKGVKRWNPDYERTKQPIICQVQYYLKITYKQQLVFLARANMLHNTRLWGPLSECLRVEYSRYPNTKLVLVGGQISM